MAANLWPQGTSQVEINNCEKTYNIIQPVVMADTGDYLPSGVHIQSLYGELILMVANNPKEPVMRTIVTEYNGKWEAQIKSDYFGLKIIMYQVINFSSYK